MDLKYVKCLYGKGVFSNEYGINIVSELSNWCWVNCEDVIPADDKNGYVHRFKTQFFGIV